MDIKSEQGPNKPLDSAGKTGTLREGFRSFYRPIRKFVRPGFLLAAIGAVLAYSHITKRRVDHLGENVGDKPAVNLNVKPTDNSKYAISSVVEPVKQDVQAVKAEVKSVKDNYASMNKNLMDLDGFIDGIYRYGKESRGQFEELLRNEDVLGKRIGKLEKNLSGNEIYERDFDEEQKDIMGLDISKGLEGKVMVPELAESSKVVEPAVQRAPAELPLAQPLDGPRQRDAIEDWAYARHFNNNNYTDAQLKESPITTLLNKPIRPDLKGYGAEPLGFVADGVQIPFEGVAYVAGKTPFIGNILEKSFKYGGRLTGGVVRAVPGFGPDSTYLLTHPGKAITENTGPSIETIITDVALGLFINYMRRDHDHKNSGGSSRPSDAPPIPIDGAK